MKTVLKNGTEYYIASYGILTDTRMQIAFTKISSYDTLREQLTASALKSVKIYTSDTEDFTAFENYTKFINASITMADDDTLDVVIAFEKEDEVSQKINDLYERQSLVEDAINELILG